ncbi:hypothetical protein RDI58_020111 [Solanum bulbocastanum]|uniref:Uncharacterized protein n=1 Tax=Solanum bulbocastanum TaxID=147425 RepID=A0AAN8T607_SOLBU
MDAIVQKPYDATVRLMMASLERNLLPDTVIRRLLAGRLRSGYKPSSELQLSDLLQFVHSLREMPIAVMTEKPKSQHYELPTSFFKIVLGKHLKYRSQLKDGHTLLDVGCGWGSLSLYIAQKYSACEVTGICNSVTQKAHIEEQCRELQLRNLEIIVADISIFEMEGSYDRILSIEMFEHMKNYGDLLKKMSRWMKADSLLFVHYFCHKAFAYHFEVHTRLADQCMSISSASITDVVVQDVNVMIGSLGTSSVEDDVSVVDHWLVNGKHYAQTSEEWLKRMDENKSSIKPIMESTYGKDSAVKWTVYWRTFFLSVAELCGYNNGEEWMVAHFLFKKK